MKPLKWRSLLPVAWTVAMAAATTPASSQTQGNCLADQQILFVKAIEKISPRVITERGIKPADNMTYEGLLPAILVGR